MSNLRLSKTSMKSAASAWTWTKEGLEVVCWCQRPDPKHHAFWVAAAIVNVCRPGRSSGIVYRESCAWQEALDYFINHHYGTADDFWAGWPQAVREFQYVRPASEQR
jgi:hypothetical protein